MGLVDGGYKGAQRKGNLPSFGKGGESSFCFVEAVISGLLY